MQEVELAPHQKKAVRELRNGSILTGGVGTGKTRVAIRYYIEKESPKDVYVITTAKKRDSFDWEDEARAQGLGTSRDATFHGVLTVDSWNNLWKYVDVEGALFIFDEQRLVGSGAWVGTFHKIAKKNSWILLSATPGDTWMDYIPVFVANGFYKHKTEFLREHVVFSRYSKFPKVERYIAVGRLVRHRNALLVDMPYERHTTRILRHVDVEYDEALYKKVVTTRWHPYEKRPLRDVAELFGVMRKVVNTDASRLEAVRSLSTRHPKLIVFYNFDYELELLRKLGEPWTSTSSSTRSVSQQRSPSKEMRPNERNTGPECSFFAPNESDFALAEWNGHKHQEIPKTDRWIYLVQYTAGAEGWNCIETDACVFFSLNYSYRIFEQCQGRIDRLNTPFTELNYYILRSKASIDAMIWRALRVKRKFNEPKTEEEFWKLSKEK